MRLCPHCGTQNSLESTGCMQCGQPFAPSAQPADARRGPSQERAFRGTMIGLAPPAIPNEPRPPAQAQPAPLAERNGQEAGGGGLRKTMIGIAPLGPSSQMPGPAPLPAAADPTPYPTPPAPPEPAHSSRPGGTQPYLPSHQKTMLGVALPGIAPLHPDQPKPGEPPRYYPAAPEPPNTAQYSAVPLRSLPRTSTQAAPAPSSAHDFEQTALPNANAPKPGIPPLAAAAIVLAGGLFAAAAVVWLFYRGQGPIEAHASTLPDGNEQLELACASCEDGTRARLDAATSSFKGGHAVLLLSRPLNVGENPMTLALVSPRGKQTFVDVSVPVAFRVRGDTSGLEGPRPELRVLVNAVPGSTVSVEGKPLPLNAAGQGTYPIDVTPELTGLDPSLKRLERRVPYVVTPPKSTPQSGVVTLQAGITPLVVDAPGSAVVLDGSNFVLAGRTAKAGALTVSDRPITVDPSGHFAQMMNVSAPGETTITIRASSKDSAPRLFPVRVKRVESLVREAERVRQRATSSYAAIAEQPEAKRGWAVALDGIAADARTQNYTTVIVMDVASGCPHAPCLARITYGGPSNVSRGDKLSAFGEVVGVVDGPRTGMRIPEVRADFLIRARQ